MDGQHLGPKLVLTQPAILVFKLQDFLHHKRSITYECVARQCVAAQGRTCQPASSPILAVVMVKTSPSPQQE
jgi:hypothetical protein